MFHSTPRRVGWALVAALLLSTSIAQAQDRVRIEPKAARRFATLPVDADSPEGIAVDPSNGDVTIGTLDLAPDGAATNFLVRFDRRGKLLVQLPIGVAPVAGLAFNERDRMIYLVRLGNLVGQAAAIQRVPAGFDAQTQVESVAHVPEIGPPPGRTELTLDGQTIQIGFPDSFPLPLGLVFRPSDGTLFITDALQAAIFQVSDPSRAQNVCPTDSSCVQLLRQDALLASAGFPQLGANDLALSTDESTLFVSNTGDDRLLALDLGSGALTPVAESLGGIDGLVTGPDGTLIASLALADEIVVLDAATGRILAELGEFRGIRRDGSPRGLLFPGSIARRGQTIFASNLALVQTGRPAEPEGDVTTFTISRIRIPRRVD